jgi:F0F1-type ATP synthase assembly protein I
MVMVGEYTSLAFALPAATVVGWGIGYLLDRAFHTHFLYIVFLILGIAAGFVQLVRQTMRDTGSDE